MRRIVSLLFLLCFAWAQAAAAACAMSRGGREAHGPEPVAHASHHHAPHGGHAGHGAPSHEHPDSPPHGDHGECMAMPCGAPAIPNADAGMARAPLIVFRSPVGEPDPYASPSLPTEPPPPRASIPS